MLNYRVDAETAIVGNLMTWDRIKRARQMAITRRQPPSPVAHNRAVGYAARAHNRPSESEVAPEPSKAQLRAEGAEAVAAWEQTHPPPPPLPPWGPWSEWRTVTGPHGNTYKERHRSRISNDR